MSQRKSREAARKRRKGLHRRPRSGKARDRNAGFESHVALAALQFAREKIDDVSSVLRAAEDDIRQSRKPAR